jgi:hypothetical protein
LDGAECGVVGDGAAQGFGGGVVVHAGHEPEGVGGVVVGESAFGLSGGGGCDGGDGGDASDGGVGVCVRKLGCVWRGGEAEGDAVVASGDAGGGLAGRAGGFVAVLFFGYTLLFR